MSWLFGILRKKNRLYEEININEDCQKVQRGNLSLAVSKGINSYLSNFADKNLQLIVGVPIEQKDNSKSVINSRSFQTSHEINPDKLFGHFVYLRFSETRLEISNDIFGLRELYYIEKEQSFIFSTRIDLLTKYLNEANINSKESSSLWLTHFQLSTNSIFNEIKRLGPNGRIVFENANLNISNKSFIKSEIDNPINHFSNILSDYSQIQTDSKISLALSGGIDCRLLFSYLLKKNQLFKCHTYINEDNKDLKISKKICTKFGMEQELIKRKTLKLADLEHEILNFYKSISPVIPLTQLLDFGIFGKEYLQNHFILDGGFGEFYRRQFYNRLYLKGYKSFNTDNISLLINYFITPKPNIFNNDFYNDLMKYPEIFIKELLSFFEPPNNNDDFSDILDFIALKYKLSNVYSAGQTVLDNFTSAIMPLAQRDTMNAGLNISPKEKMYSKFIKKNVKMKNPKLAKINLVKDNLENPYSLSNKITLIRLYLYRKYVKRENFQRYIIFQKNKEYVLDILNSKLIVHNKYLNFSNNKKLVEQFYNGDLSKGNHLDWLLTFVYWLKANKIS